MAADLRGEVRPLADGRSQVSFVGEVDVTTVDQFRATLARAAGAGPVVADLSELTYLDSAGVDVLFDVARRTQLEVAAGPQCSVRRLLDVVSLGAVATLLDEPPG